MSVLSLLRIDHTRYIIINDPYFLLIKAIPTYNYIHTQDLYFNNMCRQSKLINIAIINNNSVS